MKNVEISWQGGTCPFQAGGFINGEPFYFRYRHSRYTLDINNEEVYAGTGGGVCDGTLSNEEFNIILTKYLNTLGE